MATEAFSLIYAITKSCDQRDASPIHEIIKSDLFDELLKLEQDWIVDQMQMEM